jgi:hypothetical protein
MRAAALLLPVLLAACAGAGTGCPAGTGPATVAEAYLGRSIPGGATVAEAEWRAFLAETVTPAFPDGLTVLEGLGQWRDGAGRILQEESRILVLVLPGQDAAEARSRMRPVEEAWKRRFRQESVLTVYRSACVAF